MCWTSMKAITESSWYVKLAGDSPRRISQNTHSAIAAESLNGGLAFRVGLRLDRRRLWLSRRPVRACLGLHRRGHMLVFGPVGRCGGAVGRTDLGREALPPRA